jgi:hypothetical protein
MWLVGRSPMVERSESVGPMQKGDGWIEGGVGCDGLRVVVIAVGGSARSWEAEYTLRNGAGGKRKISLSTCS